ncbi:ABC transporter [Streptomyces tanashiensis]|uniref:FtsX-like permease family protein n=1 Tax=Streptomyces tanashiensis TaxID=67367 RepID=UPI0016747ED7|nr:ABC transporter permease [Streptomyces tanashiensis]GGS71086.1 ABC transporter [Streptomyces tanashiensis]
MSPSLLTFTLKDFRAQLRRLVLTGSAVAVGVAFLVLSVGGAGALVQSYEQSAAADVGDAAVQVVPGGTEGALPAGAAAAAARVPEVTSVAERLAGHANVIAPSGRPLDDRALVTSIAADPALRWQRLDSGRWPEGPGEVVLDRESAERVGAEPGGTVRVTRADGGTADVRLTGILDTSASQTLGSQPAIGVPHAQARAYATGVRATHLDLSVAPGADALAVARAAKRSLGGGVSAYTHAGAVDNALQGAGTMYAIVLTAALSFVLIAMAVARMVVTHTFSVVLAQRARQLALLRCVGTDRDQLRRIIRRQGLMLGALASAAGLAAGAAACALGTAVINGFAGLGPIEVSLLPGPWTFGLAGAFGVLLTLWAVRRPARAAAAVPPVAALAASGSAKLPEPGSRAVREAVSVLMLVAGAGLLALGAFGGSALSLLAVTIGAIVSFFGVLRYAQHLLPPLVGLLGLALRRPFGTVGRLSVQQLRANARRTAAASSAMLVGVTVAVSAVTAIGAARGGLDSMLADRMPAVFALDTDAARVPADAIAALRAERGLTVTPVRTATLTVDGRKTVVAAADPAGLNPDAEGVGAALTLKDGEAIALSRRPALTASGTRLTTVSGAAALPGSLHPDATVYVTGATLDRLAPGAAVSTVLLNPAGDTGHDAARAAVDRALTPHPEIRIADTGSDADLIRSLLDRMMLVVTVLLGFSIAIAALGVAATLMLTVEERTREFGMLRAIGLAGEQLRRMLTLESVLLALTGAVAGTLLGLLYGTLAARSVLAGHVSPLEALASSGGTALTILGILAATVLTGVAASVLPARRVRRMVVVDALQAA